MVLPFVIRCEQSPGHKTWHSLNTQIFKLQVYLIFTSETLKQLSNYLSHDLELFLFRISDEKNALSGIC